MQPLPFKMLNIEIRVCPVLAVQTLNVCLPMAIHPVHVCRNSMEFRHTVVLNVELIPNAPEIWPA